MVRNGEIVRDEKEHKLQYFDNGIILACMRPQWNKDSELSWIWFGPDREKCFETMISVLQRGNFDVILNVIAKYFEVDDMVVEGIVPIFVSHFDQDVQLHRDLPGGKGLLYKVIIPLYIPAQSGARICK